MTLDVRRARAELIAIALTAAREAGALVKAAWRKHPAAEHKGRTDLVTRFDRESEQLLRERLSGETPFPVVGEEAGGDRAEPATKRGHVVRRPDRRHDELRPRPPVLLRLDRPRPPKRRPRRRRGRRSGPRRRMDRSGRGWSAPERRAVPRERRRFLRRRAPRDRFPVRPVEQRRQQLRRLRRHQAQMPGRASLRLGRARSVSRRRRDVRRLLGEEARPLGLRGRSRARRRRGRTHLRLRRRARRRPQRPAPRDQRRDPRVARERAPASAVLAPAAGAAVFARPKSRV